MWNEKLQCKTERHFVSPPTCSYCKLLLFNENVWLRLWTCRGRFCLLRVPWQCFNNWQRLFHGSESQSVFEADWVSVLHYHVNRMNQHGLRLTICYDKPDDVPILQNFLTDVELKWPMQRSLQSRIVCPTVRNNYFTACISEWKSVKNRTLWIVGAYS